MTAETVTAQSPQGAHVSKPRQQVSIEEILASLNGVAEDFEQISKLLQEEKPVVTTFFATMLKVMQSHATSLEVSASKLPFRAGAVTKACITPPSHLTLTFQNGNQQLWDLKEDQNRDLLMAVAGDVLPKLNSLIHPPTPQEEPLPPPKPAPAPIPAPVAPMAPQPEPPSAAPEPAITEPSTPPSIYSAEETAKINAVTTETLDFLELLSHDVFEIAPISRFFEDWMVNFRQVILSFESNCIIKADDEFINERDKIFSDIEAGLADRLMKEAELEVSTKSLAENKQLLGEIDAGYAAQAKDLVVKGKSAMDFLIQNVRHLEAELAELNKVKASYLHPLKRMAKEQKQAEITKKLDEAKKRLAMTVQTSTVSSGKKRTTGDIDAEYAAQSKELAQRRKTAINFLAKEVRQLEKERNKLYMESDSRNPIKKLTIENKLVDINLKLDAAKKRWRLAEQDSGAEQKKLEEEYLKKKQATVGQMQTLEQDIAKKTVDTSGSARVAACNAMATVVKAFIARKTAPPPKPDATAAVQ